MAGGEPVRIPLTQSSADSIKLIESCDGVLLPGSKADVDPAKYQAMRDPHTNSADLPRDIADELLLRHAYDAKKPIFGICYGLQILNVYRKGTLLQHIESQINHEAGRKVPVAHEVAIEPQSKLSTIVANTLDRYNSVERHGFNRAESSPKKIGALAPEQNVLRIPVNSSHHQSADAIGDGLRIVAKCPDDGIVEALEGTSPDQFVLAVQWHPERSVDDDDRSRALFRALVQAAAVRAR